MARNRTISPDFWTWEAVIDCAPMTRLLFIGLWNFADDGGVQPLRPRTIRMQVFPGDAIDEEAVRAMIGELVSRKLVRTFEVEGQAYLSIVDWEQIQSVGKRARRRYPHDPAKPVPSLEPAAPVTTQAPAEARPPSRWRKAVERRLRKSWPGGPPADTERWIITWIAEGHELERDVLPAIIEVCRSAPDRGPPTGLHEVAAAIAANRARRASGNGVAGGAGTARPRTVHAAV